MNEDDNNDHDIGQWQFNNRWILGHHLAVNLSLCQLHNIEGTFLDEMLGQCLSQFVGPHIDFLL